METGETVEQAAVREAAEEIGVDPASVRIVGALTPLHIPVSGFTLHPIVAVSDERPPFTGAAAEVARILEVPLARLVDGDCVRCRRQARDGVEFDMPYFDLEGEVGWGATAMVLSEFVALLGVRPDPWRSRGW
jgi:8-oxo-dGTP pyrophosphatase MutT (NUDIX family)